MSLFDISITVPAGTYVLGDPCYNIYGSDSNGIDRWDGWLERVGIGDIMAAEVPGSDHVVVAFSTSHGDGCWVLRESGVKTQLKIAADAGMIGLIPVAYIQEQGQVISGLDQNIVQVVHFNRTTRCHIKKDGTLVFGRFSIQTDGV